jgi:uncharacterized protein DUF2721
MQYGTTTTGNPFAVLTAVVAPAILTNACSLLVLATSNRLARVVDRTRVVTRELAALSASSPDQHAWATQVPPLRIRAQMLIKALRLFYAALGLFAASTLVSVSGSVAAYYEYTNFFQTSAILAIVTGASAVASLATGSVVMVRETQLAVKSLEDEAKIQIGHRVTAKNP